MRCKSRGPTTAVPLHADTMRGIEIDLDKTTTGAMRASPELASGLPAG